MSVAKNCSCSPQVLLYGIFGLRPTDAFKKNVKRVRTEITRDFCPFFTYTMKFVFCIFRSVKHILNKYPISTGGILDKYVGYSAHYLAVLQHRAA